MVIIGACDNHAAARSDLLRPAYQAFAPDPPLP